MAGRPKKKPEDIMKPLTVRMPPELMEELKEKARPAAISRVIRKLVRMYVRGEINFVWTKEDDEDEEKES